jgi:fumarate hydratase class II
MSTAGKGDDRMRKEKDALGEVLVPEDKYFGAQTQRAVGNFDIGREYFPPEFIRAHAVVKKAAARVNKTLGSLEPEIAEVIERAADEVIGGSMNDHFPLVIWQSGSGTQFNMNVNEVIANRAIELLGGKMGTKSPVHPNDHVNMAQSTNDTIPTSMHIATVTALKEQLLKELELLEQSLTLKAEAFREIVKIGRTHLQDATPLTLGQEFSGYASQVKLAREAIEHCLDHLYELAIGGTAVGTGLNTREGFDIMMVQEISTITGHTFRVARNKFAGLAAHDAIVETSGSLKMLAAVLMKIANDIRWLASGPRCGLGELNLPANEPGSSIMPGKINPTQCEMVTQVAAQVFGNDVTITMAGSQGNFELNVFKPILAYNILQSIILLAGACRSFRERAVAGIEADRKKIEAHLRNSLMLVTALAPHIGYDKAAEMALRAWREEKTLKEVALEQGLLTEEEFTQWVRPEDMVHPSK